MTNRYKRMVATRAKNKSWLASRKRCAKIAAKALHTKHKASYKAGRKTMVVKLKKLYSDPVWKAKRDAAVIKVLKSPERRAIVSKARKTAIASGKAVKFWEYTTSVPSKGEKKLAVALKAKGIKFKTQFSIPGSRYRADFYIPKANLIVEVDGHPFHYSRKGRKHSKYRDRYIKKQGFEILHLEWPSLNKGSIFCAEQVVKAIA